jgi:hypothetical protein
MIFTSPEAEAGWNTSRLSDPHLFGAAETAALAGEIGHVPALETAYSCLCTVLQNPTPARIHQVADLLSGTWIHGEQFAAWCRERVIVA